MVGGTDATQKAIQQFMIGQKGDEEPVHDENKKLVRSVGEYHMTIRQAEKRYSLIFKRFCSFVEGEWMVCDDQLGGILQSIANIRSRLPMEKKCLNLVAHNSQSENWMSSGFNQQDPHSSLVMSKEDIEISFSHDLIQHERMMASARSLLSSLSECQGALNRKLNEVVNHHREYEGFFLQVKNNPALFIERMNEIYAMLSIELYRKQCLVHTVLDTNIDDVLSANSSKSGLGNNFGPMDLPETTAKRCCIEWPRGSKYSFVNMVRLSQVMLFHESTAIS
mmetsp:Transcript_14628/g.42885  ORF Transcript_14628/g.42885 Transcript_14628/m.42885 type:complete len:279 (-) Transcript_14628:44-880(-)|eukprot:CAMPEP_0113528346 /NCGR_PEP_ID=MMETSP0015_2-20120614/1792_1 /TAXON_ID=2838 /ORGANISM="Odontella" /LENGTH=278 /DNA_ID=CAMNT_0000426865 /DNA_START=439 /DNA_END=1275 /DNA_ORIENTATION=- /assembly_acc=CAM_ASM_000160